MNSGDLLERLFSLHRFGIRPGLGRIASLVALLGNPQNDYPIIHVAGTNGKGSVCSMLTAALTAAGYRTGLYTSPHIRRFNERIRIDGNEIHDADVARLIAPLLDEAEKEHTTFFEITTAAAFRHFSEQRVDVAVIETGMGGRLDATTIANPAVSVITSIDFDHAEYLGNTLDLIAREKAGIIKPKTPVIVGETRPELQSVFAEIAAKLGSPVVIAPEKYRTTPLELLPDFSMRVRLETPCMTYENLRCGLAGAAQAANIATVAATLDCLHEHFPVGEEHFRKGLRDVGRLTGLRGRIELLRNSPPLVLDVGHNPACLRNVRRTLGDCGYSGTAWQVVFGVMADKAVPEMLGELAPLTETLYAAAPDYGRALPPAELARLAAEAGIGRVETAASVADAVRAALETGKPTLVTGSFYVADEALAWLDLQGVGALS